MTEHETNLLLEHSRELRESFDKLIADWGQDLWNYCRYLTGSPWDGEDLYQETLLKTLGSLYQRWHHTNLKSYLYRIATNSWIDHCRREKRNLGALEEFEEPREEFSDHLDLQEALEQLFHRFTPRQTAVFLLKEVFRFTAEEVASMVKTTPGAVYAATRRMKSKLKDEPPGSKQKTEPAETGDQTIQAYMDALTKGDVEGMLALFSDQPHYEASLGFLEVTKEEIRNGSLQFGLPGYRAEPFILWGKPVVVVFADSDKAPLVHDIQYQEVENGKIVLHKSYFFRKEFIVAAAKELGFAPQFNKPPLNW
ncbi:MAG TPA: sigma-70 family RNA polymerase sigma factor [Bacillales bacterium]|nr:sigma-70 family RNA polymerase sigma factor [Bacillales bacterium]